MITEYRTEQQEIRADFVLDGDFVAFTTVDPARDPVLARPVPHTVLRRRFEERFPGQRWLPFVSRTVRRWRKWLKYTKLSNSDVILHGNVLQTALNTDFSLWTETEKRGRPRKANSA